MRVLDTYTHFFLSFTFLPPPPRARVYVSARPRGVKGERRERSPLGRHRLGTSPQRIETLRPREQRGEGTEFLSLVRAQMEVTNAWMH